MLFYVWQLAFNAFFRYDILVNGDEIMKRSYVLTLIIALAAHSHAWDFFSSKPARPRVAVVESQERSGPAPICLSKQQQQKQVDWQSVSAGAEAHDARSRLALQSVILMRAL